MIADRQARGRGRLGRAWHSPAGLGLYISVLFRPRTPFEQLTRWTLGASLAACEACRAAAGPAADDIVVKWPNDLLHRGRKLAGILCEARGGAGAATELVIGAGFNVGHVPSDFPLELSESATSLRQIVGASMVRREPLAAGYLRSLARVATTLESGGWDEVATDWMRVAPGARGQRVQFAGTAGATLRGVTAGLDPIGALRIRCDDGSLAVVHAADALRPLES